jgi:hypothetical protein
VYNYCNICNFPIYFYNIYLKHLQHTSETLETYACNMRFQRNITLLLGRMELIIVELDAGKRGRWRRMELAGAPAEWQALRKATSTPGE